MSFDPWGTLEGQRAQKNYDYTVTRLGSTGHIGGSLSQPHVTPKGEEWTKHLIKTHRIFWSEFEPDLQRMKRDRHSPTSQKQWEVNKLVTLQIHNTNCSKC